MGHSFIVLALDASTTAVGWVIADGDEHLESGVYRPKGRDAHARIEDLEQWLGRPFIYQHWKYAPIEAVFYEKATGRHGNMETDRLLGAVEHAIVAVARRWNAEVVWVVASQVKASGVHKDTDDAIAEALIGGPLHARYPGDHKDAIGVWLAGLAKWRTQPWEPPGRGKGKREGTS
jgi:hypothetical protein